MPKPNRVAFQMHMPARVSGYLLQENRCDLWDPIKATQYRDVHNKIIWITVFQTSKTQEAGGWGGGGGVEVEEGRGLQ